MLNLKTNLIVGILVLLILSAGVGYHQLTISSFEQTVEELEDKANSLNESLTKEKITTERLGGINDNWAVDFHKLSTAYENAMERKEEADITLAEIVKNAKRRDSIINGYSNRVTEDMLISKPVMLERRMTKASEGVYLEIIKVSGGKQ